MKLTLKDGSSLEFQTTVVSLAPVQTAEGVVCEIRLLDGTVHHVSGYSPEELWFLIRSKKNQEDSTE